MQARGVRVKPVHVASKIRILGTYVERKLEKLPIAVSTHFNVHSATDVRKCAFGSIGHAAQR